MYKQFFVLLFILTGVGCTTFATVPTAARVGDTVLFGVGSPQGMDVSNTTLLYNPGAVPLPIRSIFNIYPDKTSLAWQNDATIIQVNAGHGPWTTIIAVDLPDDGSLTVGPSSISVTTSATYVLPLPDVNDTPISIEILPAAAGSGSPNPFKYLGFGGFLLDGDLSRLEPKPRILFRPDFADTNDQVTYGCVEVAITSVNSMGGNISDYSILIDQKVGFSSRGHYSWSVSGATLTVYFISPTGTLLDTDIDFTFVSDNVQFILENGFDDFSNFSVVTTYYDINGVVTTGPTIQKINKTGT